MATVFLKGGNMTKKSIKKNYIYNVSYQILLLITPLITTPYLSRILGADGIGTASYVESIASYFTLFATMGMTTFGQREVSYVQDNKEKRTKIFWETNILELFTSTVSILVYIIMALKQENAGLYFVLVFNIISVTVNVTWFFQGLEEFGLIVLRNVIFKIINIAYIFLFVKDKGDVIVYLFGLSFFSFLSNASLWIYLPRYIGKPNWKELRPFRHIKVIISLFIPTIATQVYTVFDKTMIGLITKDACENGYYEQAIKISKILLAVVTALGTVMIPRIGYHYEQKNIREVKQLMYRGYRFVWFLGIPLCFGLIMVSNHFVPWFYGDGYEKVSVLLKMLAFLIPAIGISNVTGLQYLIPTKRQNLFTFTVLIGAVTNFAMNVILIGLYQSAGAAVASVMAEIMVAVVQLWLVRKELSPWKVVQEGWHYYMAGAVMAAVLWLAGRNITSSIINTIVMVVSGAATYFLMLLLLRDVFFIDNVTSILGKVKHRRKG